MPVPSSSSPVRRRSLLREDVYSAIREAIVRGQIAPGEKLVDAELQQWLGVSRTPIREALLRLERTGLVTAVPGRSTMATPYDAAAVDEARVVAAELHALAVRLAVPQLGEEEFQRLRSANEDLRRGVAAGNPDQCVGADDDFHHVFITGSSNAVLIVQLEQVMPVLRRAEYLHFDSARAHASITQHEEIIATVEKGDASAAADFTRVNWMSLGS